MLFSGGRRFSRTVGYLTTHVGIPAELPGGAMSIQRHSTGSFSQGVAFRLAEPGRREW